MRPRTAAAEIGIARWGIAAFRGEDAIARGGHLDRSYRCGERRLGELRKSERVAATTVRNSQLFTD
ncbi:hypothetical protein [Caballeronia fortuita]|uniref:hypothetical protein n=1 Tax=Caballeronia fortuita TaxID=1777138 RepID=UPI000B21F6C1|nr:hypothetical protein [Caballeronia fortuita]